MPALVAGISLRRAVRCPMIGMAGTSPAMTQAEALSFSSPRCAGRGREQSERVRGHTCDSEHGDYAPSSRPSPRMRGEGGVDRAPHAPQDDEISRHYAVDVRHRLRYLCSEPRPIGRAAVGRPQCGARAVPAGGLATPSRAASGTRPTGTTTGLRGASLY
jgi:hypothetical protein